MYIYIYTRTHTHIYLYHVYGRTPELDDRVMRVNLAVRITACDKRIIDRVSFNTIKGVTCIKKNLTYLVKASKNQVLLIVGKATRTPDIKGECRTTAPTSYRAARSTVGTVPML